MWLMARRSAVTGDKELVAALRVLGRGMPASTIDRAATRASKPMVDDAVQRARSHRQPGRRPKGGHIDETIKFLRRKESSRKHRQFVFGATGPRKSILTWLEFGTLPHFQPRRFGGIFHPGARRFPVLRPAFDAHSDGVTENFGREYLKELTRMIGRLRKGPRRR